MCEKRVCKRMWLRGHCILTCVAFLFSPSPPDQPTAVLVLSPRAPFSFFFVRSPFCSLPLGLVGLHRRVHDA